MRAPVRRASAVVLLLATLHASPSPATADDLTDQPTVAVAPAATGAPTVTRVTGRVRDVAGRFGLSAYRGSWSIQTGHVDGDGRRDLVLGLHNTVRVFRTTAGGLVEVFARTGGDSHGCTLGDVNGDGLGDVYCALGVGRGTGSRPNWLFVQQPDGTFVNQAAAHGVEDRYGRGRHTTFLDLNHDGRDDLFVGNQHPRQDRRISANRTFTSRRDGTMRAVHRAQVGAGCVQAADFDRDGWEDLLVCGWRRGDGLGNPSRLHLYRNVGTGTGGRRLAEVADAFGVAIRGVEGARLAQLVSGPRPDLVVVTERSVQVRPGHRGGFGPPVLHRAIEDGSAVAVGNFDGRSRKDVLVVQGCRNGRNTRDLLLVATGGSSYRAVPTPHSNAGCGDEAAALDLTGDGRVEFVVGNNRWGSPRPGGPMQVLTLDR